MLWLSQPLRQDQIQVISSILWRGRALCLNWYRGVLRRLSAILCVLDRARRTSGECPWVVCSIFYSVLFWECGDSLLAINLAWVHWISMCDWSLAKWNILAALRFSNDLSCEWAVRLLVLCGRRFRESTRCSILNSTAFVRRRSSFTCIFSPWLPLRHVVSTLQSIFGSRIECVIRVLVKRGV